MSTLAVQHPNIHNEFSCGNFVVKKTNHIFSALGIDHAHEQANAMAKGDGGVIGLIEDPSALRRWMIAGPEDFNKQI